MPQDVLLVTEICVTRHRLDSQTVKGTNEGQINRGQPGWDVVLTVFSVRMI